ncbi:hypothetical protein LAZ67_23001457 [Cordylochernes scorpioides]|uniref:Uncharacterized protein n=1 Tax=Cordylochernes scorpioides TaxID=51811 RepID=A0ABY6LRS1_9ARAC|nr:hypothetical protein LAZ67_23001457 [Cordylochernes scorpioides]
MEGNVELGRTHAKKWRTRWNSFRDEMSILTELEIPRYIFMDQNSKNIQLHGFCEASSVAFSAVCYLKSGTIEGQVKVSLIAAKKDSPPCKTGLLELRIWTFIIMAGALGTEIRVFYHLGKGFWNGDSGLLSSWKDSRSWEKSFLSSWQNAQYALDRTTPPGRAIRPNTHVRDRYEQHPRTPEPTLGQGERTNGDAQTRTPNTDQNERVPGKFDRNSLTTLNSRTNKPKGQAKANNQSSTWKAKHAWTPQLNGQR